jgi:hypothetical protein
MLGRNCSSGRVGGDIFFVSKLCQITTCLYTYSYLCVKYCVYSVPWQYAVTPYVSVPVLTFLSNILPSSTRTKYEDIKFLRNVGTSLPICVMSIQEDRFFNADRSSNLKCHSTLLTWSPFYSSQRVSSEKKHWFEPFSKDCALRLPATRN